jgi:hypothetical protein
VAEAVQDFAAGTPDSEGWRLTEEMRNLGSCFPDPEKVESSVEKERLAVQSQPGKKLERPISAKKTGPCDVGLETDAKIPRSTPLPTE